MKRRPLGRERKLRTTQGWHLSGGGRGGAEGEEKEMGQSLVAIKRL